MHTKRLDTQCFQLIHLVVHKSNQRGDHNANAFFEHSRDLEAYGFPSSRRQKSQGIRPFVN